MLAIGANVQRLFDDLAKQHAAALGAAHPKAFGDAFLDQTIAGHLGHNRYSTPIVSITSTLCKWAAMAGGASACSSPRTICMTRGRSTIATTVSRFRRM